MACCGLKVFRFIERADFIFISEENINMAFHEVQKCLAVAANAERVGQGERDLTAILVRKGCRAAEGFLRVRRVKQIAFQIHDSGGCKHLRQHIFWREMRAGSQIRRHGALAVGCDHNDAARRRQVFRNMPVQRRGGEGDAVIAQILRKFLACGVMRNLAQIRNACAKLCGHNTGICGRAPAHNLLHFQVFGQAVRTGGINQRHAAGGQILLKQKRGFDSGKNVRNCVANAENIVFCLRASHDDVYFPEKMSRSALSVSRCHKKGNSKR